MDLDLLQRLMRSRLPILLDRPGDVAAFMLLRDANFVCGSMVSENGCTPQVSVTSVTLDGRAYVALLDVTKRQRSDNQGSLEDPQ